MRRRGGGGGYNSISTLYIYIYYKKLPLLLSYVANIDGLYRSVDFLDGVHGAMDTMEGFHGSMNTWGGGGEGRRFEGECYSIRDPQV